MSDRKALIAGNWKMYKTVTEAVEEAKALADRVQSMDDREMMIAPTYTALAPVSQVLTGGPIAVGAQNLFWENEGAFTGEISAPMLISAGCSHVIIPLVLAVFQFREEKFQLVVFNYHPMEWAGKDIP